MMMERVKEYITQLSIIYLGTVLSASIYLRFLGEKAMPLGMIGELLVISMIFSALQYIFYSKNPLTHKQIVVRRSIHYISLVTVFMTGAYSFEWIDFSQRILVISLGGLFSVTYIMMSCIFAFLEKREVALINQKIEEYKQNKSKGKIS